MTVFSTANRRSSYRPQAALLPRALIILGLAFILLFAAFVRLRLLDFPLERDEGEYAYAGQLLLHGIPPYQLAYNMKLPGTYAVYALIMGAFGQTIRGIHIGLILVNSITILLLYFAGKRLFGTICGLVAAGCFALLCLSDSVLGLAAHATHFVTLFAVAGTLVLLKALENQRPTSWFCCGLLFGLAFVMKQTGVFFVLFPSCVVFWKQKRPINWIRLFRHLCSYCAGAVLPFVITCLLLAWAGVFNQFWFWTFSYAGQYATLSSLASGWVAFRFSVVPIIEAAPALWLLAAIGIVLAFSVPEKRHAAFIILAFFLAAFAAICPGLYFRQHYYIPLLSAAAIFVGAGFQIACEQVVRRGHRQFWLAVPLSLFVLASGQLVFRHRTLFFRLPPDTAARFIYHSNPLREALEIGRYIQSHAAPDSRIAVIGSEPEIYFYCNRRSATGYIYTYPLMEPQKYASMMQRQMISEIEAAAPEFVVFVDIPASWIARKSSDRLIFDWARQYTASKFREIGLVEIDRTQTVYRFDENGISASPRTNYFLWLFRRKETKS